MGNEIGMTVDEARAVLRLNEHFERDADETIVGFTIDELTAWQHMIAAAKRRLVAFAGKESHR